jgi:UDP-3-O-[3-hydroxymyristoyl] glucosamine N-acyltransferase
MGNKLTIPILASELADRLRLPITGADIPIASVEPLPNAGAQSLSFANKPFGADLPKFAVVIAATGSVSKTATILEAANPRLAFARALQLLRDGPGFLATTEPARVEPSASVAVSAHLGRGVQIGARTVIEHNVVIADGVKIGADCHIKSNTVIGEAGFGFERDEEGVPIRILHLGSVIIGDRVELGSLNTVCRATLGNTVIEDDVKSDDHVHIAHNCTVRRGALLTACTELSGGVEVGAFAWIGPNSSVIQKVSIGDHAFVGIGSNVTKSVASRSIVAGNPAKLIRPVNN